MTVNWTPGFVDPAIRPPDIEWLTIYYLTQFMGSTPIGTRLPNPSDNADTVNGFLRVEAGGGNKANYLQWNMSVILHAYSPNEIEAEAIIGDAMGWMTAARGQQIAGWSVVEVPNCTVAHRYSDPQVIGLTRYRAMVTWRVPGQLMVPGGS